MTLSGLPSIANAKLPEIYQRARDELAQCARVDECKGWADKAAALASYAKQADDKRLENLAMKIRARAIKRCGELLKKIEPKRGANQNIGTGGGTKVTRKSAAKQAGMSKRQKDTALRVANVPDEEFEAAVESKKPATLKTLARKGTKKRKSLIDLDGRDPADFKIATAANGAISAFVRATEKIAPSTAIKGMLDHEYKPALQKAKACQKWLGKFINQLERKS